MSTNMSNSERLTQHNARLDALIELAESLPNAGSGGMAKVTITSNCVGINGDTAKITVTSTKPFAPDPANPSNTVTTWTVYAYDMPDCTIEIPTGSTIECVVNDTKLSSRCYVKVNGTDVLTNPGTYTYTVTKDVAVYVADEYSMGEYGTIVITE